MTVVTSKPSPVEIGQGRNRETIYTATRTTKMADGTYSVEMLQYSNAKGQGGKVIAERDSVNEWTFKDGVSKKIKQNEGRLNAASKNQMESMRGDFVTKSQEAEEYNRAQGEPNKATETETGDSQTADPPASTGGGMSGDFVYPKDTIHQSQDVIQFTALEYSAKSLETFRFGDRPRVKPGGGGGRSIGTVTLPIQSGIKDQVAAGWGEDTMNPAQMAAAAIALKTIKRGGAGFSEATRTGMEQMQKDGDQFADAVGGIFAEKAAGVQNLLTRTEGKIINPNLELLFKKPTLRQFSLAFKLSARNDAEAQEIVQIIRFFKENMSPKKGKGASLFLEAPNTFQVHYLHRGSKEHPYIGRMKECAMTSFEVDYTPEGNYSTYKDGFMTSYMLSMSLKELEPVFSNDYDDIPGTEIGF
tara:strand:- start:621 stop:1865 length:1245 start_codon:yes stop_codon:yes gene_type:complete